ncbi:MAG TPA: MvaI/BcnI family restriction endonuclease, partial [Alphaproteobacteria bacterium]|nr:MvaI/BcnI family restriction endonuclease [Alphaproteobacteria bacterium]
AYDGKLHAINLTRIPIDSIIRDRKSGPIWELLSSINSQATFVSRELLARLQEISRYGLVPSVINAKKDTAIGRTLETMLGIKINSRKEPDYKGIELKSFRSKQAGKENRKTLFAQVAKWELSKLKSSAEILRHFGYARGNDFKLYCTVSTQVRNSQGLQFLMDHQADRLVENSSKKEIGDFAVWLMQDLRKRLVEKHSETFWVSAKSHIKGGNEFFEFKKALHTKKPIVSQFDILLEQGSITMDHLIKRTPNGRVSEKGPLFKIQSSALEMLFPPSQTYDLQAGA